MSMPSSEPSPGTSSSRRGSSTTMTMLTPSGCDNNSKVSEEEGLGMPKYHQIKWQFSLADVFKSSFVLLGI